MRSVRDIMSTLGDTMSTVKCSVRQRVFSTPGGCSVHISWVHQGLIMKSVGDIMSTLQDVQYTGGIPWVHRGSTMMYVGDIMSTVGVFSTPGRYHEYTRGYSVNWRNTTSTPGDFATNEKKPWPNFEDFCSRTFCDYAVVYVGLWNIRQIVKISPTDSQSVDPNTFIVSFDLIKSL